MTDNAFRATFSDFRLVRSRSVAQVVLEIPLEAADQALAVLGGVPRPDQERWVAVARLAKREPLKQKAHWSEMAASQRAGILCRESAFIQWFRVANADTAANVLRQHCGVISRRELDTNETARKKFEQIETDYMEATGRLPTRMP